MSQSGPAKTWSSIKEKLPKNWLIGLAIIIAVFIIAMISKRTDTSERQGDTIQDRGCSFIRTAEYSATQASQDTSPSLALMHATYGLAMADAAQKMASEAEINNICGRNTTAIQRQLESIQRAALTRVTPVMPASNGYPGSGNSFPAAVQARALSW